MISQFELANKIDHTLLKPDSTFAQVKVLCEEAIKYKFASVCVLPNFVIYAKDILCGSGIVIATVIGFPLGANITPVKLLELDEAIENGANELDVVVNNTYLKSGEIERYREEIELINNVAHSMDVKTKFIIETSLLTQDEKILSTKIINEIGADFVKTSTGFIGSGATIEDVVLLKSLCSGNTKVKASGGIRTLNDAISMIQAGAERIGTSSGVKIINELLEKT